MARIFDNIKLKFEEGLNKVIGSQGVKRVDFCVGYFNLRGWNLVVNEIDRCGINMGEWKEFISKFIGKRTF